MVYDMPLHPLDLMPTRTPSTPCCPSMRLRILPAAASVCTQRAKGGRAGAAEGVSGGHGRGGLPAQRRGVRAHHFHQRGPLPHAGEAGCARHNASSHGGSLAISVAFCRDANVGPGLVRVVTLWLWPQASCFRLPSGGGSTLWTAPDPAATDRAPLLGELGAGWRESAGGHHLGGQDSGGTQLEHKWGEAIGTQRSGAVGHATPLLASSPARELAAKHCAARVCNEPSCAPALQHGRRTPAHHRCALFSVLAGAWRGARGPSRGRDAAPRSAVLPLRPARHKMRIARAANERQKVPRSPALCTRAIREDN